MLSDEERMAIEHLKNYPINWLIENVNESGIKIIINLIEKQSKEIESLKEDNKKKSIVIIEYQDLYEKLEDKIKAKIDFIKNLNEKLYYEENVISILQSLLEKE